MLVNLENFLLIEHKEAQFEKYIPTILKLFYDEDLLSEEFLVDWGDGKLASELKKCRLYNEEIDNIFKKAAEQILNWLRYYFYWIFFLLIFLGNNKIIK